jgi:uncharacterized Zn finger protein
MRQIIYGEGATFTPVCEKCGRFVSPDKEVLTSGDGQPVGPNATCSRCGRVAMTFEGYV